MFRLLVIFSCLIIRSEGENILGIFVTYSRSHQIISMAVAKAMAERGHNLTVITTLPVMDSNPNYRHIQLKNGLPGNDVDGLNDKPAHPLIQIGIDVLLLKDLAKSMAAVLEDPILLDFLEEDNHFDLMLMGYGLNEFLLGIAAHYNCPVALVWIMQPVLHVSVMMGNPLGTEYVPAPVYRDAEGMDFRGRFMNLLIQSVERLAFGVFDWYLKSIYDSHFSEGQYPSYWEMKRNISLVLVNHHFSEGPVRALVPGVIEIGGIHIKEKHDPLPQNVAEFIDSAAETGFVYFSLGSNTRVEDLGENAVRIVYNVLSRLPQKVVWKYESDELPGQSENILFSKWLPQVDILGHRNLRLFITHGGKGGITEAIYYGVPMVGLPVTSDQPSNVAAIVRKGFGLSVDYTSMTEELLNNTIYEVLQNPKYTRAVKEFSSIYKDRPISSKQTAVFWLEYVMRHKGAPHLQSPLMRMHFIEQHNIDVFLCIAVAIFVWWKIMKFVGRMTVGLYSKKFKND